MTRFCLVRHGETDWNAQRRLQGHLDIPLNANGLAQAGAVARSLADAGIAAIYSSDLLRARQTAEPLARELGLVPNFDAQLRERCYGIFEGLTYDEARRLHPEAYAHVERRDPDFAVPGGESLVQLRLRIGRALRHIAGRHSGQTVLVVTHGGVLDIAYRLAASRPLETPRDFLIGNATCNWIEWSGRDEDGRFILGNWGEAMHLADTLDELPG